MNKNAPYITNRHSTPSIMRDVIVALLPIAIIAYIAYGNRALLVLSTAIGFSLLTEFIFSSLFLKKHKTVLDGSSVITGLLMAFTISPITPWYVVAFGATMATLFSKVFWGGIGKNRFNPALVGREFMVVFFPLIMSTSSIWKTKLYLNTPTNTFFGDGNNFFLNYLNALIYNPSGAIGEYSVLFLILGGLYLIARKRISWHIPTAALIVVFSLTWLLPENIIVNFSTGGLLLAVIYMATDMPSSPSHNNGKLYYGAMIGLSIILLILGGVKFAYLSFSILILNGFSNKINEELRPTVWGQDKNRKVRVEKIIYLTGQILFTIAAVITLNYYHLTNYLIYAYIIVILYQFYYNYQHKITNPI